MGGSHHLCLVGTSPINPTTMSHTGYIIRKFSYASSYLLFISLMVFFSLPAITVAVDVQYTRPAAQCGPFHFALVLDDSIWDSYVNILPLDDLPVGGDAKIVHDNQTKTVNFTLDKLPLKTGTQFVFVLEYQSQSCTLFSSPVQFTNSECSHDAILMAYVLLIVVNDGIFVSSIQTVDDSSDSSCVSTNPSLISSFFLLDPPVPSTCSIQIVKWNQTRYQERPKILVLIPGGQAMRLDHHQTLKYESWHVNVRTGTQMVVFVESPTGLTTDSRTSPLITVTAGQNDDCLPYLGELKSTAILSTVAASTTALSVFGLPESTKKVK